MPIDLPPVIPQPGYERRESGLITKSVQEIIKAPYIHKGLKESILPGMMVIPGLMGSGPSGPTTPPTIANQSASAWHSSGGSPRSFTGQSLGSATADRVIISAGGECVSGGVNFTNFYIASSAGSIRKQRTATSGGSGTYATIAIATRLVTSGTTGTQVHYTSSGSSAGFNANFRMTGWGSQTPSSTGENYSSSGSAISVTVTMETWQRGVAMAHGNNISGTASASWSANCTELGDVTGTVDSGFSYDCFSAARINSSGTVTCTFSRSSVKQIIFAVWDGT